ncbi:MAG: NAD(P) transhydrogenase subunit alpha, partial [Lentisphaerae bacterium]|nr:NAD(P) transhydrogenase subunit alpha [Lentisphaerota bacterium]
MRFFIAAENDPAETRTAMVPDVVSKLCGLDGEVAVQAGIGRSLGLPDAAYAEAGAAVEPATAAGEADVVMRLNPPSREDVARLRRGSVHIGLLNPFRNGPVVRELADAGVSAICMELIPRTTLAQKMDALSSQANLAGYAAVILAAERLDRILPMMMTPAGTIPPAKVFVIGAGVAGLQAIATARRLGARVEAFDTRPVTAEQVESLGARFVTVDLGETGETDDGYARELTAEQLERQRQAMARHAAAADVVITTAQVFGRPAPRILTRAMVEQMRPGSLVVDMAVETGGNVEGSEAGQETDIGGVR